MKATTWPAPTATPFTSPKDPMLVKSTQAEECFSCHAGTTGRQLQVFASSDPRGQSGLLGLPRSAWLAGGHQAAEGIHRQRDLLQLPCRQARPDAVGTSAGARRLHQLPHAARLERAAPDGRADELPLLLLPQRAVEQQWRSVRRARIVRSGAGSSDINCGGLANQRTCVNCHSQVHGSNSPSGAYLLPLMQRHEQGG